MRLVQKWMTLAVLVWILTCLASTQVHAHLMVAQHGTLNVVDDGAFLLLSLPISAFTGVDEDGDGRVSMIEFNHYRTELVAAIQQQVTLSDSQGSAVLEGIRLSPVKSHQLEGDYLSQIAVIGRFALLAPTSALRFQVGLYGMQAAEQSLEITATRRSDNRRVVFELTPAKSEVMVFADNG